MHYRSCGYSVCQCMLGQLMVPHRFTYTPEYKEETKICFLLCVLFPGGFGEGCDVLFKGHRNVQERAEVECVVSRD